MKKFIKIARSGLKPKSQVGGSPLDQQLEKQNTRTLMQALHGCRQNCRECSEEEAEWEPKIIQKEVKHA